MNLLRQTLRGLFLACPTGPRIEAVLALCLAREGQQRQTAGTAQTVLEGRCHAELGRLLLLALRIYLLHWAQLFPVTFSHHA